MKKIVLITGAAGFIGSNLAKNILQKDSVVQVIGIDNLNDYYDVSLKEYRLKGKYVIIRICPQLYFSDTLFS